MCISCDKDNEIYDKHNLKKLENSLYGKKCN